MRRAVIINGRGEVRLANGRNTPYDLDKMVQAGAGIGKSVPLCRGDSILLIVNEIDKNANQKPAGGDGKSPAAQQAAAKSAGRR
jgi:hypothetical protein